MNNSEANTKPVDIIQQAIEDGSSDPACETSADLAYVINKALIEAGYLKL